MERSGQLTQSEISPRVTLPGTAFYQVLDVADVDVDLRSLIDRWSVEGEVAVIHRRPAASPFR